MADLTCLDCRQPARWSWTRQSYAHASELRAPFTRTDHQARVFPNRTPSEAQQEYMDRERRQNFEAPCFACGNPDEPFVTCPHHAGSHLTTGNRNYR